MIAKAVANWEERKGQFRLMLKQSYPKSYSDLVKLVIHVITDDYNFAPDPERIHVIDDGDYQGTLVFVIPHKACQPSTYWYVKIEYGSYGVCDTLQGILDKIPDEGIQDEQIDLFMIMALHIVQGLRPMQEEEED